jgi:hypothetical protein
MPPFWSCGIMGYLLIPTCPKICRGYRPSSLSLRLTGLFTWVLPVYQHRCRSWVVLVQELMVSKAQ